MKITLKRSGLNPVEFDGKLIASGGLAADHQFERNAKGKPVGLIQRGHRLELYRSTESFVMSVQFRSAWINEPEYSEVSGFYDLRGVAVYLNSYSTHSLMLHFVGPPAGSMNARKNLPSIIRAYQLQFRSAVAELFGSLPAERIP